MDDQTITEKDQKMAARCVNCPVCNHARKKQRGTAYWFVSRVEGRYCPYSKAYEKVYGRKPYEPVKPNP